MSFFQDRGAELQAAVDAGDAERAADLIVHSMLEGPGSITENLDRLIEGAQPDKG